MPPTDSAGVAGRSCAVCRSALRDERAREGVRAPPRVSTSGGDPGKERRKYAARGAERTHRGVGQAWGSQLGKEGHAAGRHLGCYGSDGELRQPRGRLRPACQRPVDRRHASGLHVHLQGSRVREAADRHKALRGAAASAGPPFEAVPERAGGAAVFRGRGGQAAQAPGRRRRRHRRRGAGRLAHRHRARDGRRARRSLGGKGRVQPAAGAAPMGVGGGGPDGPRHQIHRPVHLRHHRRAPMHHDAASALAAQGSSALRVSSAVWLPRRGEFGGQDVPEARRRAGGRIRRALPAPRQPRLWTGSRAQVSACAVHRDQPGEWQVE